MRKKEKIRNTKKRTFCKTVFIMVLMVGASGISLAQCTPQGNSYWITGNVSDSSCDIKAIGHTVVVWYDDETINRTDIIGPSAYYLDLENNKYIVEMENLIWDDKTKSIKTGVTVHVKIISEGDECRAGPVDVIISGDGFDNAPDMTLICGIMEKSIKSYDEDGNEKDDFIPGQNVSIKGAGLSPNTNYAIWIQKDPIKDGAKLNKDEDPSGKQEMVKTDKYGDFALTELWAISQSDVDPTPTKWDIVVDNQGEGVRNEYDSTYDGLDSASSYGFMAPVPEPATFTLIGVGLIALMGYVGFAKKRE